MITVLQNPAKNQEKLPTSLLYGYSIEDHDTIQEFLQFLIDHPKTCPVLVSLLSRILRHKFSQTSQETMAKFATTARESVNRMIKAAVEAGYIKSMGRFWKTSIYSIGDLLNSKRFARFFLCFVLQAGFNRFWFPIKDYNQSVYRSDVTLKEYMCIYNSSSINLNKEEYNLTSKGNASSVNVKVSELLKTDGLFINKLEEEPPRAGNPPTQGFGGHKTLQREACKPLSSNIGYFQPCRSNQISYRGEHSPRLVSYDNPKAAEAYKDFLLNRYDRLVTMLTGIGRLDMLTANMAQFLDNLSYNDRLKVEKEVSETKKLC